MRRLRRHHRRVVDLQPVVGGSEHSTPLGGSGAGAAYVYIPGKGAGWSQQSELIPSDSFSGAFFGWPTITFDGPDIVISAPYTRNDHVQGSLGVLGPTRMHYERAMTAVAYVAQLFSEALTKI